ncbi:hypothetical protein [Achromobacter kerstersii]
MSDFSAAGAGRLVQNPEKSKACDSDIVKGNFFVHHAAFKQKKSAAPT